MLAIELRRAETALFVLLLATIAVGCDSSEAGPAPASTPVEVFDRAHDADATNDFLRLVFLPQGVEPSGRLGAPGAVRVFATASPAFQPPLSLAEVAGFLGVNPAADRELLAMRCSATDSAALDARLATWPEVFDVIQQDLGGQYRCPPHPGSPENQVYCLAAGYVDEPKNTVVAMIAGAVQVGAELQDDAARAAVLQRRYGIALEFSGIGATVKGSGLPHSARESLRRAVSPEYLLLNATLAAGGCSCIRVAPYQGREQDPLDPNYVDQAGELGECPRVQRLETARK